jgi:cytochrome c1
MNTATLALALAMAPLLAACRGGQDTGVASSASAFGNVDNGHALIERHACGACHTIPGVHGAVGVVGPPLDFFSRRSFIAGELPNTPANLQRWLLDPSAVEPRTAMPNVGLAPDEARDIAAYLSTLR